MSNHEDGEIFVHVKIWCLHSWFQSCSHLCTVLHLYINSWFSSLTSQQLFIAYVVEILPSVLWRCWLGGRKGIWPVKKTERWGAGVVICLEQGADLHRAQLIPPPLTVSCFSKIQIGFTFLVPAHQGSPGQRAVKRVCVCVPAHPGSSGKRAVKQVCYVVEMLILFISLLMAFCTLNF